MNMEMPIEQHDGGEVHAFTPEQQKNEQRDAIEMNYAGYTNDKEVSYLTDPQIISEELDSIEMKLSDNAIEENQLLARKEALTNKLKDLEAQKN